MAAAGFKVWFLDGYRSTPEESFAVRFKNCDCGIMITASHNPPTDNAVKVYWSTGGQLLPPHDNNVIDRVYRVKEIVRIPWEEGLASGRIEYCQEEVDAAFVAAVLRQSTPGPRDLKIIYSPLHGVGASAVCPVLDAAGFKDVEVFGPHATPDPDFTNVPGHVANPENAVVFDAMIARGREIGADLILATDPDCDRLGCAARLTPAADAAWGTLTGNQVGSLLTDSLLAARKAAGTLHPGLYVVKTLVTTELMRRIADNYGVQTAGNLLVGFKYIGGEMDLRGPQDFVFGAEESYGFLAGDHVRDKDAAVASLLLAELAAGLKAQGKTLHQQLDDLVPPLRLPQRKPDQRADARRAGHGRHEDADGQLPLQPAAGIGRHEAGPRSRLSQRHGHGPRRQAGAAGRAQGRHGDPRPGGRGQLRGRAALGHGAEGEVLHVRLRPAGGIRGSGRRSRPRRQPG